MFALVRWISKCVSEVGVEYDFDLRNTPSNWAVKALRGASFQGGTVVGTYSFASPCGVGGVGG